MSASIPQKGLGPGMPVMPTQQQQQQQAPSHMAPGLGPGQPGMPPQGALREISPVYLCRIGQETVQDIVTRTMEIFQITRATQVGLFPQCVMWGICLPSPNTHPIVAS